MLKKKCLETYIEFSYKKINKNNKKCRKISILSWSRGFFQRIKLRKVSNIISGTYSHVFWVARDPFSKQYFFPESRIPLLSVRCRVKTTRTWRRFKRLTYNKNWSRKNTPNDFVPKVGAEVARTERAKINTRLVSTSISVHEGLSRAIKLRGLPLALKNWK